MIDIWLKAYRSSNAMTKENLDVLQTAFGNYVKLWEPFKRIACEWVEFGQRSEWSSVAFLATKTKNVRKTLNESKAKKIVKKQLKIDTTNRIEID